MTEEEMLQVFYDNCMPFGRMISGSKFSYRKFYPLNYVLFNANVIMRSVGKIWYGDLDITKDRDVLMEISGRIGEDMYVLQEMDMRFETEDDLIEELVKRARAIVTKDTVELSQEPAAWFWIFNGKKDENEKKDEICD